MYIWFLRRCSAVVYWVDFNELLLHTVGSWFGWAPRSWEIERNKTVFELYLCLIGDFVQPILYAWLPEEGKDFMSKHLLDYRSSSRNTVLIKFLFCIFANSLIFLKIITAFIVIYQAYLSVILVQYWLIFFLSNTNFSITITQRAICFIMFDTL